MPRTPQVDNLPVYFHPTSPWGGRVQRGVIIDGADVWSSKTRLYFQYNPDVVRVTYQTLNQITNDEAKATANITDQYMTNGLAFSFNIFFDRRLDYYTTDPSTGQPNVPNGVIKDIEVLQTLMGIRNTEFGPQGVARQNALTFIFGGSNEGSPVSLKFYAYISGLDVQYTHFSPAMIPLIATASISAAIRTKPDAAPPPPPAAPPAPAGPAPPPPLPPPGPVPGPGPVAPPLPPERHFTDPIVTDPLLRIP